MEIDTTCTLCHVGPETLIHTMRDCSFARKVWNLSPLPSVVAQDLATTFQDWFHVLRSSVTEEDMSFFRSKLTSHRNMDLTPLGWTKINVATKLLHADNRTSFGLVHHDSEGTLVFSSSTSKQNLLHSIMAKLHTLHLAIVRIEEQNWEKVNIEVDCRMVQGLMKRHHRRDEAGLLATSLQLRFNRLRDVRIEAVPKECNQAAHEVANHLPP